MRGSMAHSSRLITGSVGRPAILGAGGNTVLLQGSTSEQRLARSAQLPPLTSLSVSSGGRPPGASCAVMETNRLTCTSAADRHASMAIPLS